MNLNNNDAAWVAVNIACAAIAERSDTCGDRTEIRFDYICSNQREKTVRITAKGFGFKILDFLPGEPPEEDTGSSQYETEFLNPRPDSHRTLQWEYRGHRKSGQVALLWGVVKYEDDIGSKHESGFGYTISADNKLQRINLPAYNRHT